MDDKSILSIIYLQALLENHARFPFRFENRAILEKLISVPVRRPDKDRQVEVLDLQGLKEIGKKV
jgi:hypothetical protein